MLNVNDIHVYYGAIHAVKGVSFEVNDGEIVTLIGANGAGKSTVLKTVSGILHATSGSVTSRSYPAAQDRRHGPCACAGGTARVRADDRGGEPGNGGVYAKPRADRAAA